MTNNKYLNIAACFVPLVVISFFFFNEVNLKKMDTGTAVPALSYENKKHNLRRTSIIKSISSSSIINREQPIKKKTDGRTASVSVESTIPWKELNQQWMDEVQKNLVNLDPLEGEKIFQRYLKERLTYRKSEELWGIQMHKVLQEKPINKILQKKLENQSEQMIIETETRTKNILGKYYGPVADLHKEFTQSIQVYSRDIPIAVDSGIY